MLTTDEIKTFLKEDDASQLKQKAREGQRYYEGLHDILDFRMFYWNAEGDLVEDKTRSNVKIPHPFFTELVDQATQHILSGGDIFKSDIPKLQKELDTYFNDNETFLAELAESITGTQSKGFEYMHAYQGEDDMTAFENADCLGVVEVDGRFTADKKDQYIWKYVDRVDKEGKTQFKILVIDDMNTYYYMQTDDGEIVNDTSVKVNPRPHFLYTDEEGKLYVEEKPLLPFFRLDHNKKRQSLLPAVKALIDDYDLMASSLTNNLIDFDTPIHVIKGFRGDNLDELQKNLKTKKIIGVDEEGGIEVHTVDVPYQARKEKLEIDEKNIYRFGMGLNMSGLKDTSATTNIAIKAMYSLLELRCAKLKVQLKQFLRKILKVVIDEINHKKKTGYKLTDVYFAFEPEIMSNAQENAQIALIEAQEKQVMINILLSLAPQLGNELMMQNICETLELDFEEIKGKLPKPADDDITIAKNVLDGIEPDDDGGGVVE